jgi:uncharacterized protein (DUF305 family)
MCKALPRTVAAVLLALVTCSCSRGATGAGPAVPADREATMHQPAAEQLALGITQPWSDADIAFMTGMIPHHAQAVIMAGWAPTHGARADIATLCERMVVGQTDEIRLIQQWLADRGLPVPDAKSTHMQMKVNGAGHEMLMPGMLTDAEMAALDKARGPEFDRLFLLGMIKHHEGAVHMVDELMKSYGAAQDDSLYKFASDVHADQSIEIGVMKSMLEQKWGGQ